MADILINKDQWDALSKEEQERVVHGLLEAGALQDDDRVVGDANVPPFDENTSLAPLWNPLKDICKALCDSTAAAGVAWCAANTAGAATVACIAVAEVAREECKNRC